MAPVIPSTKRRSLRTKLAAKSSSEPYAPRRAPRPDAIATSDAFINSKRDKRTVKHASFVSRIEKAGTSSSSSSSRTKRRRPGKKLVANLDSLKEALPDLLETEEGLQQMREGKTRHKSLRSKKGALKRKEVLVKGEVERFGVSLARLSAVAERPVEGVPKGENGGGEGMVVEGTEDQAQVPPQMSTANRWAALRGFISATMEQNPAFVEKKDGK
ncbi:ribosome biogenesis protein SLX9-domain-containing protein [Hypoxylon fragiforme]|uniref:ribosome biogenesis protein SLX9-domain-containing protein n=1 Tax=Hypoxylon fragiforme TaxID=63214 RepID=UPI0020C5EEEB|nr:ribosome biogenesis protein SLX9-domain-containing protein [Hypoxylon fragiforme]KAI2613707.1 ribosome biogenesis protein SLX9-domain-containing protein [Hypoxylon fragiforme]